MPRYSEKTKRKIYADGMKLAEKGMTKTAIAKDIGVGKKFFSEVKKEFPDLPDWPTKSKQSSGVANTHSKEDFMVKYDLAVEHYKKDPTSVHASCKAAGIGRDTFIKYAQIYELMDLPEYVGKKAFIDVSDPKFHIKPELYALAFMAIGGFYQGMGYQYQEVANG